MTAPDFVRDFLERHGIEARSPTAFTSDTDLVIPTGARNDTLAALYGLLIKMRIAPNIARAMLIGVGTDPNAVAVPMDRDEIEAIAEHLAGRESEPFDTSLFTLTRVTRDSPIRKLEWLVPGIVPAEGITLIHGLPAQGKSYTAQDMILAVATGRAWLGRAYDAKRPRRVAYFDWERRGDMFKRRMAQLARGLGGIDYAIDYYEVRGSLGNAVAGMGELILVHGYEFAVIDSLSIAIMTADMMSAHEVIPRMFALHELGIPILCLDHQKKLSEGGGDQWQASAFGSVFKEAVASMVWQAGKTHPRAFTEGFMDFKLHPKKNNFDLAPEDVCIRLVMDSENDLVRLENISELPIESRILDELGQRGEMSKSEMIAVFGVGETYMRTQLKKLLGEGVIRIAYESPGGRGKETTYTLSMGETE